ncbi:ATP-binding domain-containing protein [Adlercreutzia sp. R25]|uniref:ATP-binding domain-containing protein n=1 Tax=Adlercreutzia shanghongiae TaxID=3111773 RepID=UPI002DBEF83C|nr:ATP-binding domain-containing protein [Adlercreutzia sp. R25]MEC4272865.1 ATP-binding domain-containing protein [Adlercreutzia sp. R25]
MGSESIEREYLEEMLAVVLLDADGRQYASEVDRNLLYVAVTRAMHALTVLYRDEPSPFLR